MLATADKITQCARVWANNVSRVSASARLDNTPAACLAPWSARDREARLSWAADLLHSQLRVLKSPAMPIKNLINMLLICLQSSVVTGKIGC